MSAMGAIVIGGAILLVVLVLLEGKRQERRYGRGSGRGASLTRAGMLALQQHLEPERKVEVLLQAQDEGEAATSGEPPVPGSTSHSQPTTGGLQKGDR